MSGNTTQSIEDVLSQRNSNLTQSEIENLSATIRKPNKKGKFKQLLDSEYQHKSNQEMSLAGMVMCRTGDAELAAKTVACSEITEKSDWSEAEIEEKQEKIIQWYPEQVETDCHSKTDDNDDDEDDNGPKRSQNTDSNGLAKKGYESEYDKYCQGVRSQLPSRI